MRHLGNYVETLSYSRMIMVCLVTPLPCLVLSVLNDLAPLASPEEGVTANWVFWIRFWTTACLVDGSAVLQIGHYVPRLTMKMRQVIVVGVLTATVAFAVTYAVAAATVFPLPVSTLVASPPTAVVIFSCFVYYWGAQLKADTALRHEVLQQIAVFMCEMSLTFVYPVYIYGFLSMGGTHQAWFSFVLVIIKLISKNVMSRILEDQHDIKPALVVFNVEVFNALYVSSALQSASSLSSAATVIMVNVLQFWLSMYDIFQITTEINGLMNRIPYGDSAEKRHFLQVALDLLDRDLNTTPRDEASVTSMHDYGVAEEKTKTRAWDDVQGSSAPKMDLSPRLSPIKRVLEPKRFVCPLRRKNSQVANIFVLSSSRLKATKTIEIAAGLNSIFSRKDRLRFLRVTARLLFITEYIILVKYTAVILPIIYSKEHADMDQHEQRK